MKYFMLLLSVAFLSTTLFGQRAYVPVKESDKRFQSNANSGESLVADTLGYWDGEGIVFTSSTGGYVNGTNGYGDLGKYQRFDLEDSLGNVNLTQVIVNFGAKGVVGTADTWTLVLRALDNATAPGVVFHSQTFTTNEMDTTGWTTFTLTAPMEVEGSFFVGIEWTAANDDSFAVVSDVDGFGAGNPSRVWERWSDLTFYNYMDESSWELDIDLWIGIIFEGDATSVNPELTVNSFSLNQNYPNPFNPSTTISFNLIEAGLTTLAIYDMLGREVTTLVNDFKEAGAHTINFNAPQLSSGVYYYKLTSGNFTEVRKMSLLK